MQVILRLTSPNQQAKQTFWQASANRQPISNYTFEKNLTEVKKANPIKRNRLPKILVNG